MIAETMDLAWQAWAGLEGALQGRSSPLWIALALVLTTFLLEDVAIAAGVALAVQGSLSWGLSFAAVAGGIALGDVGLYAAGWAVRRSRWVRHTAFGRRVTARVDGWRGRLQAGLVVAVVVARIVPGLRLVTYTACGFVQLPFWRFTLWVAVAVMVWTAGLYAASFALGDFLSRHTGVPLPWAVVLAVLVLALGLPALQRLYRRVRGGPSETQAVDPTSERPS